MALPKQKFREIVLLLLYSYDIAKSELEDVIAMIMETLLVTKKTVKEAQERVDDILLKVEEIDKLIQSISFSYAFERIQKIECNIIRLGAYEIIFDESVPYKVAISEAIRLARKFSTPEAATFVNALLDAIYQLQEGKKIDPLELQKEWDNLQESQKIAEEAGKNQKKQSHD